MSSGVQRSRRSNASLNQKPYAGFQSRPKPTPKRQQSGFLDGLKSIVTGPLAWLSGTNKEGDEEDEEVQEAGMAMGSKRAKVSSGGAGGPPKKKARKSSPSLATLSPLAPSNSRVKDPVGYLDPPTLKDSVMVSNNIAPSGPRLLFNTLGRPNGEPQVDLPSFPPFTDRGVVPPQNLASSPIRSRLPAHTEHTPENYGLVSQSPFRPSFNLPPSTVVSPNSGIRRTSSAAFQLNKPAGLSFSRSNATYQDPPPSTSTPSWSTSFDQPMRSPRRQLAVTTQKRPLSRSPSAVDLHTVNTAVGRIGHSSDPEHAQQHIPLSFGSARRSSYAIHPYGGPTSRKSLSPSKSMAINKDKDSFGGLVRRSSSLMTLDQSVTANTGLEGRRSSQMVFDKNMGITTIEEVEAQKPAPRPPRNNAERILLALEQATPLTEARKLRQRQKEAIRVPTPSPYARPSTSFGQGKSKKNGTRGHDAEILESKSDVGGGALRKYLDSGRKERLPTKEEKIAAVKKAKEEAERESKQKDDIDMEVVESKPEQKAKETKDEIVQVDGGSSSSMSNSPAPARSAMPGRNTSALRAGREKTFRSHAPSSRPTNKFSARFDDDDDIDVMEEEKGDSASLTVEELAKWSTRGGGTLEIPAGFKFTEGPTPSDKNKSDDAKRAKLLKLLSAAPASEPKTLSSPVSPPKAPSAPFTFAGVAPAKSNIFGVVASVTTEEQPARKYPASLSRTTLNKPLAPPALVPTLTTNLAEIPKPAIEQATPMFVATPQKVEEPKGDAPVKTLPFSFGSFGALTPKPATSITPAFKLTAPTPESKSADIGRETTQSSGNASEGFKVGKPLERWDVESTTAPSAKPSPFSFGGATAAPTATASPFSFAAPVNGGFSFGASSQAASSSNTGPVVPPSSTPAPPQIEPPVRSSAPSPSPFAGLGMRSAEATTGETNKASVVTTPAGDAPSSGFSFTHPQPPATPTFAPGSAPSTPLVQPSAVPATVTSAVTTQSTGSGLTEVKPLFGASAENKPASIFGSQPVGSAGGMSSSPFSFSGTVSGSTALASGFGSSGASNPFAGVGLTPSASANVNTGINGTAGPTVSNPPTTASPFSFSNIPSVPKLPDPKPSPFSFSSTTNGSTPAVNGTGSGAVFKFGASSAAPASPFAPSSTLPGATTSPFSFSARPKTPPPQPQSDMMDDSSPTREAPPPSAAPSATGFQFGSNTSNGATTTAPSTPFNFSFGPAAHNPFAVTTPSAAPGSSFSFGASTNALAPQTPSSNAFGGMAVPPVHASPFSSQPNSPFQSPATPFKTLHPAPASAFGASNGAPSNPFAPPPTPTTPFNFSGVTSPQANAANPNVFVFGAGQPSSPSVASSDRPVARLPRRAGSQSAARRPPPRR